MERDPWSPSLRDLIWELSGRRDDLKTCWLTALADVGVVNIVDEPQWIPAFVRLKPFQPLLVKTLEEWLKRQEELQPLMEVVLASLPDLESKAALAMEKLLELVAPDSSRWDVLNASKDVNVISLESTKAEAPFTGRVLRTTGFLFANGERIFNHIWASANQVDKLFVDLALFRWGSESSTVFELRTQLFRLPWPLENRETLLVRMGKKIGENKWALVCTSVTVDHERLAVQNGCVRAQVWIDGYVIEQLPYNICRVVRVFHLDPVIDDRVPNVVGWAQETRFGVAKCIEDLRDRSRDNKLEGAPIFVGAAVAGGIAAPLAATGVLSLLGFGAGGIVAGSWAAGAMGASVVAGSPFALAQSAGVVGVTGGPLGLLIASGAIVIGGASIGTYYLVKHIKNRSEQAKFLENVRGGDIHVCTTCGWPGNKL
jgi:hypothetical protein